VVAAVCLCLSISRRIPTLLHGPRCSFGERYGVPPSCALLGRFAIGARFRCYDSIAPSAKCQRVLVLVLCLVRLGTGAGTDRGFADWGILVDRSYNRATDEGGNSTRELGSMLPGKIEKYI